ncbi:MAG: murein L,D-transpeptidase catalytic domain family protein [Bacteroidales bacterium]|nr:murein L,D-transpeptidase catalytic domain family protein [Bacteroidales bacterium]
MICRNVLRYFFLFCLLFLLTPQQLTTQQSVIQIPELPDEETELLLNNIKDTGINSEAFFYAYGGYRLLEQEGLVANNGILTVIDYSLPSSAERLFIIDIKNRKLLWKSLVAHGKNTGENYASRFSNRPGSYQSSLGFFITGDTYYGQNGYSLILDGLDTMYNELAKTRAIVIHGAVYVSDAFIENNGRLGRSFGCPALPVQSCREMIDLIKSGSIIFSYYPDQEYFENSRIIKGFIRPANTT